MKQLMTLEQNMTKLIMKFHPLVTTRGTMSNIIQSLYRLPEPAPILIGEKSFRYGADKSDTRTIAVAVTRDYLHSRSLNEWFNCLYGMGRLLTRQNTTGRILMEVSDYYDGAKL